ncbi:MAG: hypothetical protein JNM17_02730 [Archangium sp.]|nr:hypothetical protein [Archangium sp.]
MTGLYRAGAIAAIAILVLLPIQIATFIIWPPPTTANAFLQLFATNPLGGLISTDVLYMLDLLLNALVMLAVGSAVWNETRALVAPALGLLVIGTTAYVANNPAFSLLWLSRRPPSEAIASAAELSIANYQGIANGTAYVILGAAGLLLALAVRRSRVFSRTTAWVGIGMNLLMLVPSGAGTVGLVMSLLSLVPFVVWLWLVSRRLAQLSR